MIILLLLLHLLSPTVHAKPALPFMPEEPIVLNNQEGKDMKYVLPGLASLGMGDVHRTSSRFLPTDFLPENSFDPDDRPRLGYMDRETAGGRSAGVKNILALQGIGRFEMADEREQGSGLINFSKSLMPFLELPPLKEDYTKEGPKGGVITMDDVDRKYYGYQEESEEEEEPAPTTTTFSPFNPSILNGDILPPEVRTPSPPFTAPPTPFDSPSPSVANGPSSENPFDDIATRNGKKLLAKMLRRSPLKELKDLVKYEDNATVRRAETRKKIDAIRAALGAPSSTLGIEKRELILLCSRFAPIAEQECYKSVVADEYVEKCRGYTQDCHDYQMQAKPLGAIANSFSSGVGITSYSWGVNGIPYYPINEEGGIGGGSHGKVDFGSYGGGYSFNQGARDFFSETGEAGANWYEGVYGSKSGWSVPIVQGVGIEGGGGTQVHVPIKEGDFGRPIEASSGYHVGPFIGVAERVGVDWLNGGVNMNRGVAVPIAGVNVNSGFGVGFPSVSNFMKAWDPTGAIAEGITTASGGMLQ